MVQGHINNAVIDMVLGTALLRHMDPRKKYIKNRHKKSLIEKKVESSQSHYILTEKAQLFSFLFS